jgi:RNA polymerase sigma-70 factor (ECF subfamily)
VRNLFINRYRERQYERPAVDWERIDDKYESMVVEEGKTPNTPEELFSSKSLGDQITKALQEVPEDYRTAVVLVDIEELTYEETAKVMECPTGTVRSRVSRGRRLLQVALRDYAAERALSMGSTQKRAQHA